MLSSVPSERPSIAEILFEVMKLEIVKNSTLDKIKINGKPLSLTKKF